MRIVFITLGTQTEVDPCITLGRELSARGYRVTIATHPDFEEMIAQAGLDFALIDVHPRNFFDSDDNPIREGSPLQKIRQAVGAIREFFPRIAAACWQAAEKADLILYTSGGSFFAPTVAERLRVPVAGIYPYPVGLPTGDFPHALLPWQNNFGYPLNRLTHHLFNMSWLPLRGVINHWRERELRMVPVGWDFMQQVYRKPILYGFSPQVVPRPAGWPNSAHITGYWFSKPADWEPPVELVRFLNDGPPPVFAGFGPTRLPDPNRMTDIVMRALTSTGQRGVILSSTGGLNFVTSPTIHCIKQVSYDWLFPRMAGVVHHGGSGITGLSLRAGVPVAAIPFMMDQFFWGQRVADLGVGVPPVPASKLTVETLAATIQMLVADKEIHANAALLGEKIRTEDGIARAVKLIETWMQK